MKLVSMLIAKNSRSVAGGHMMYSEYKVSMFAVVNFSSDLTAVLEVTCQFRQKWKIKCPFYVNFEMFET